MALNRSLDTHDPEMGSVKPGIDAPEPSESRRSFKEKRAETIDKLKEMRINDDVC